MQENTWDNTYFEGKVKSRNTTWEGKRATEGIIEAGSYTFSTKSEEHMTVLSGELLVKLSGEDTAHTFSTDQTFIVPANSSFEVTANETVSYRCVYID